MTPVRLSLFKKTLLQTLFGLSLVAASSASLAATAVVKVNISLPQVLTTSLSRDIRPSQASFDHRSVQGYFHDSKNNGHLVRASHSEMVGKPVTYLYIQT
jgi:hypothetical protein